MRPQRMKEFEFRLGKMGLALFVVGISFLVFLAFATGVMVGVNLEGNPDQAEQGLTGILKQKLGRSAPAGGGEALKGTVDDRRDTADTGKGEFKLTFFDTLTKGKGPGAGDAAQPRVKKEEREAAPAKEQATAPAAGRFVIQVASLQEKKKAEELRDRLNSMGYAPYIDSAELSDRGHGYRVKLKGFETREQAQKIVDGLEEKVKGLQCLIVPAGN